MLTETDYWNYRTTEDSTNANTEHQVRMRLLEQQEDYNLFHFLKPKVSIDGNQWCVLYGENLQDGIAGFGDTLHKAILNFNENFHTPVNLK